MKLDQDIVIVATKNKGKVKEFEHAFALIGKQVKSMFDYEELPEVIEDGHTFAENALKKAKTVGDALGLPVLADDSGLCVEALDGQPGVYSARYAGENATDQENNQKLLQQLEQLKQGEDTDQTLLSTASFICSLVLYNPSIGEYIETSGAVDGWITSDVAGNGGFGYDPLFYVSQFDKTMAELSLEEKQSISHRGIALRELMSRLHE
ncbi:XTP/dITP diphosphatase [Paenibacillus crassostreae]|uniref:dITP/XTP pyrophosphatase n=1 Tax=Paenibacillus crassostreae TaxID=1763538 RepID=A0A167EDH9_9BACL|nr:XTP/dITP diphosphatase [Paenibacillus crassostreae]AOZ91943.1 non-canonical purine NTP pyrophosphatase, RdgB/HAM1 family [Paenibacillus crassostreae]OAB75426.1 non-canonical purine NTP pyrophosphatase [Paenibacillus crassostreae]